MRLTWLGRLLVCVAVVAITWLVLRPLVMPTLERVGREVRLYSGLELLILLAIAIVLTRATGARPCNPDKE